MLPSEIVEDAARLIKKHGWLQGRFANEEGAMCISGACRMAVTGNPDHGMLVGQVRNEDATAFHQAILALKEAVGLKAYDSLPQWNDGPYRTKKEIVEVLTTTAAKLKAEGR